jgi:hypothetical protein
VSYPGLGTASRLRTDNEAFRPTEGTHDGLFLEMAIPSWVNATASEFQNCDNTALGLVIGEFSSHVLTAHNLIESKPALGCDGVD